MVDDGSVDNTVKMAEYVNTNYIIRNNQNVGLYKSILIGLKKAKEIEVKYILVSSFLEFPTLELIDVVMKPLIQDKKLDVSFGIYENVYDHYQKNPSDIIPDKIIQNDSNTVFFIMKKAVISDSFNIPESYDEFKTSILQNKNHIFIKLNIKKRFRRTPEILIMSILFFGFSSISYLILIILLEKIIPSIIFTIFPPLTGLFFGILVFLTYQKYHKDRNEYLY